jgi:hypothetical protein
MLTLLILAVSRYDFTTKEGESLKAAKMECVDLDARQSSDNAIGFPAVTFDAPYEVFQSIKPEQLPGVFEVGFTVGRARNAAGKTIPTMRATVVKFLSPMIPSK